MISDYLPEIHERLLLASVKLENRSAAISASEFADRLTEFSAWLRYTTTRRRILISGIAGRPRYNTPYFPAGLVDDVLTDTHRAKP